MKRTVLCSRCPGGQILFLLVVLFAAATGTPLRAEEYTFVPPEFYVGDAVDLVVAVPAEKGRPSLPETIPEHKWIDVRDIRIDETARGYSVRVRFACFAPEEVPFPRLDLGSVVIENVPVSPAVLSGPENELSGIQAPILLPGTRLLLLGIAAVLILLPLGGIFLVPPLLYAVGSRFEAIRRRRSYLAARRALGMLRRNAPDAPPKVVYDELNRIFRELLTSLYSADFNSCTAGELRYRDEPGLLPEALTGLLIRAEHIRYGAAPPPEAEGGRRDIDEGLRCLEEIRLGEAGNV
ncbi:MAG: hypothetical protein ACLFRY_04435 [Spirochaetia bacterium]